MLRKQHQLPTEDKYETFLFFLNIYNYKGDESIQKLIFKKNSSEFSIPELQFA